jgi:putative endonuclease
MDTYFVYVIVSTNQELRFYVGQTDNIERRLAEHNAGKVKSTKAFIPWKIFKLKLFPTGRMRYQESDI